jgi:diamine N-acetyltransferase
MCIAGALAGGMVIRDPWLVGPYLQTIAVLPGHQGSGAGGLMLAWFEARARLTHQRNIWLCVSAFNTEAQRFYQAHGWQRVADLPDLIRDGDGEIMLRKRLIALAD